MRLGSVCSGIGGAELGKPPSWETAFVSDVEKFPRQVLAHRFPDVKLYGDFTKIKGERVDVLIGGVPCQSFSHAGKRELDNDERGQLIYKFIELAHECGARWFVIENVPGLLAPDKETGAVSTFSKFLAVATGRTELGSVERLGKAGTVAGTARGFSCAWRVLDARGFGVPQQRRRVWIVGRIGDDWRAPAGVLFEPESSSGDVATSGRECEGDAAGSENTSRGNSTAQIIRQKDVDGRITSFDVCPTLRAKHSNSTPLVFDIIDWHKGNGTARPSSFAPTITTKVGRAYDTNQGVPITNGRLRYLTPLECERLQGFPDGWTDIPKATKGKRYKALGNAFVPAICRWVLDGIDKQHQEEQE